MKKILSIIILSVCTFFAFSGLACSKKPQSVLTIIESGSAAFVSTIQNAPFTISGLNIKSTRSAFYFKDYVVDENGKEYQVKNSKNKKIGTIKLSKKSEVYNPEKFLFNLDNYEKNIIIITEEMNYVEIKSSSPNVQKEMFILIDERNSPLDLTLNNVNLYTKERIPIIFCYSDIDINVIVKGNNRLKPGKEDISEEEYLIYKENEEMLKSGIQTGALLAALSGGPSVYLLASAIAIGTAISEKPSDANDYINLFRDIMDTNLEITKMLYENTLTALVGKYGMNGRPGANALQVFDISFYGDGTIEIIGGDGTKGFDSSKVAIFGANGGDGGNSGHAILCHSYINFLESSNYNILSGEPGEGGYGTSGIGGNSGHNGSRGEYVTPINYVYRFEI